jgi:hypothetical protein
MYCSGCGKGLTPGQTFCPHCGRPVIMAAAVPAGIPGYQLQLHNYASQIRALSIFWFVYAALGLALGTMGLAFANAAIAGHLNWWMHGNDWPMGHSWFPLMFMRFAWVILLFRTVLCVAAGWGLMERAPWGRVVAIIAAVLNLVHFPFGTAVSIWTMVMLLGYRNSTLYEQL